MFKKHINVVREVEANTRLFLSEVHPCAEGVGGAIEVRKIGEMILFQTDGRKLENCTAPLTLDRSINSGSWRCVDPRANISKDSGHCQYIQVGGTIEAHGLLERAQSLSSSPSVPGVRYRRDRWPLQASVVLC
jgi:hypothetical protein